jgi:leader peptidase (prepilin peptidase)/N-methyltransferase
MAGAIFGSFANMLSYRLPRNISAVTRTRSFCPQCEHNLAWYDNVPILSYLSLFGRCRYCRKPIPVRYLLVELLVSGLWFAAAYQFLALNPPMLISPFTGTMPPVRFIALLFLSLNLVVLAVVDLECWLIPIETTLYWIPVAILIAPIYPALHASATTWVAGWPSINALIDSLMGLALGAGLLWAIGFLTTVFTFYKHRMQGSKEHPLEGMGEGDMHLLALVGALLGWKAALMTLGIAIFVACFVGVAKILLDRVQEWRLGERWQPAPPTFDLPEETPPLPVFWPLPIFGGLLLLLALGLFIQSARTWSGTGPLTMEEEPFRFVLDPFTGALDCRLIPAFVMTALGALLVFAYPFYKYLASIDMLPQGSIVENEKGEKQEVITAGHYIPFGPSLAAAALLVAFYDPLLRNYAAWWWSVMQGYVPGGAVPTMAPMPYRVIAQNEILSVLMAIGGFFLPTLPRAR